MQEVINAINEAYAGDFTDSDLVIVEMVLPKVLSSAKLKKAATANERNVYIEGIFPGVLDQIVLDAYRENDKAFDALLNDKAKYMAFLKALADLSYDEFKRKVSRQLGSYDAMASNDEYEYAEAVQTEEEAGLP